MIKKIFGFFALTLLMAIALVVYSMTSPVPDASGVLTSYKQKIVVKTKEVAEPVLKKVGIDVEKTNTEDLNVVKQQMENATEKVNEATKAMSQ